MTAKKKIVHDTFTLERTLSAPPARVFEALANPEIKAKWFAGPKPSWKETARVVDIRVGGREHVAGVHAGGLTSAFDALYLDMIPGERVVYTYEMTVNGRKISTSLATFELEALDEGGRAKTKLTLTEQGAYYDDPDMAKYAPAGQHAGRLEGTKGLMSQLAALFES